MNQERDFAAEGRAIIDGFNAGDVEPPARLRLYAATALDAFVLDENDERVPVAL